jgi:hypothetical protein
MISRFFKDFLIPLQIFWVLQDVWLACCKYRQKMPDYGGEMDQKNLLGEYLQGALAGKMIESPAKVGDCPESLDSFPKDAFVHIVVPVAASTGSNQKVTVRVRNYQAGRAQGVVTLQGEELDRGTSYDFQAPFTIDSDQQVARIVFNWAVPVFPTKVKWSASVAFEGQMGVGLSECSAATIVTRPMH